MNWRDGQEVKKMVPENRFPKTWRPENSCSEQKAKVRVDEWTEYYRPLQDIWTLS